MKYVILLVLAMILSFVAFSFIAAFAFKVASIAVILGLLWVSFYILKGKKKKTRF